MKNFPSFFQVHLDSLIYQEVLQDWLEGVPPVNTQPLNIGCKAMKETLSFLPLINHIILPYFV